MAYYDTIHTTYRDELGVRMACHVKRGGYTTIHAVGLYAGRDGLIFDHNLTDAPTEFDHSAFASSKTREAEFRNALRRHARWVKQLRDNA